MAERPPPDLPALRDALDQVDDELLALLNRRARLAGHVAASKRATGAPFYAPGRERQVIERLAAQNEGPFPTDAIGAVMQEVMSACLSLQERQRVAYLGPEGTFTHAAVAQQFGTSVEPVPCGTIGSVFEDVERGRASFGVVPVENSSEGIVSHTLDSFLDSNVCIIAEVLVEVSHCLLARRGTKLGDVRRIYSHPQALAQCHRWLGTNAPEVASVACASTAEAARICHGDPNGAAIASALCARLHDLELMREGIQDAADNTTRFLVLGPPGAARAPTGDDRTSALLVLRDEPGALFSVLEPLSRAGVNLTKIESRPTRRRQWEYMFILELEGHAGEEPIAGALAAVARSCELLRVLGAYPKAAAGQPKPS